MRNCLTSSAVGLSGSAKDIIGLWCKAHCVSPIVVHWRLTVRRLWEWHPMCRSASEWSPPDIAPSVLPLPRYAAPSPKTDLDHALRECEKANLPTFGGGRYRSPFHRSASGYVFDVFWHRCCGFTVGKDRPRRNRNGQTKSGRHTNLAQHQRAVPAIASRCEIHRAAAAKRTHKRGRYRCRFPTCSAHPTTICLDIVSV